LEVDYFIERLLPNDEGYSSFNADDGIIDRIVSGHIIGTMQYYTTQVSENTKPVGYHEAIQIDPLLI